MDTFLNTLKSTALILLFVIISSCNDNSPVVPTNNTQEYFKYTINGVERVFDNYVTAYFVNNPSPNYKKFFFRAGATTQNGGSLMVDGDFTFVDYNSFTATNSIPWGGPITPITTRFYFSELFSDDGFSFIPHHDYAMSPINCTVIAHATNVGDYLEFEFSGTYTDAVDTNITGTISGAGRMLRGNDQ